MIQLLCCCFVQRNSGTCQFIYTHTLFRFYEWRRNGVDAGLYMRFICANMQKWLIEIYTTKQFNPSVSVDRLCCNTETGEIQSYTIRWYKRENFPSLFYNANFLILIGHPQLHNCRSQTFFINDPDVHTAFDHSNL